MKRIWKIVLGIIAVLLIIVIVFAYKVFKTVSGSEELVGSKGTIPANMETPPPLTKGNSDYPNWRGPNFDGKSTIKGIKTDWTGGLKKIWSVDFLCQGDATATWSCPVVQGNRLIVPGRDELNDLVFCLNSEDGKLIWTGKYPASAGDSHGPGARATPFIDGDRVYTYGRSGDIVCWQLLDGKLLWKKNVKDEGGEEPEWGLSSTPLVIKDKVIVQGGGKALVVAYNKLNGEFAWKSLEGKSGYSASIPIILDSTQYLLIYHGAGLSCLNPDNGKELWRVPWETSYGVNASTPAIEKDLIFHTSGYDKGCQLIKASKDNYKIMWTNKAIKSQHSDPVIMDGYIYGYSGESSQNSGDFKCVELSTGKEIWSTGDIGWGTTVYLDNYMICLDIKGNLYLIQPNSSGFKKVAEMKGSIPNVKHAAWTAPVVANGKLYIRYLQHLICYSLMP